jgi:hypothetical protein
MSYQSLNSNYLYSQQFSKEKYEDPCPITFVNPNEVLRILDIDGIFPNSYPVRRKVKYETINNQVKLAWIEVKNLNDICKKTKQDINKIGLT